MIYAQIFREAALETQSFQSSMFHAFWYNSLWKLHIINSHPQFSLDITHYKQLYTMLQTPPPGSASALQHQPT